MSEARCDDASSGKPPGRMLSKRRAAEFAASLGICIYVGGLLLAAAPGSAIVDDAYEVAYPALELANVNNDWGFFSPDPGPGDLPRYIVTDTAGRSHHFELMEALDRWHPAFFRYTTLYVGLIDSPETYGPGATEVLCRKHRDLSPARITYTVAHQNDVTAEAYLAGVGIMDDARVERLFSLDCPAEDTP